MVDDKWEFELSGLKKFARGKVREIYDLDDKLLFIASDRISAFDVVLPTPIPGKGSVLTSISQFWFNFLKDIVRNHFITADPGEYVENFQQYREKLLGRAMVVEKCKRLDVECIVRGYISGSLWKAYSKEIEDSFGSVEINGIEFPENLRESDKLPEPIFTPSTKAESGHDENISFDKMCEITGKEIGEKLRDVSITLYKKASEHARDRGIIIADTKFEFGIKDNELVLIDEVLTPDSSRFWPADEYAPGRAQMSFDKQFVRDWLKESGWDKTPPGPELPADIVQKTAEKYQRALEILTA